MGIKDIKDYFKSKFSEGEKFTFQEQMQAEDLLYKMKRFNIYSEFKPEGTEWVPSATHKGQFEEKTVDEIMSDLNIEINAQMRRYDDKTLKNVMAIVSQERDNAEKRQQENTGDGFEHYTIVACKDLAAIHKTVLKERENTPEK